MNLKKKIALWACLGVLLWVANLYLCSVAWTAQVPNPHHHDVKVREMYACNHRPVAWTQRELECVVRTGFGSEAANAMSVVRCESVWNPRAVSPTGDYGLFQINRRWNSEGWRLGANIYDPVWNTRIAYYFWQTRGWGDWTCGRMAGIA